MRPTASEIIESANGGVISDGGIKNIDEQNVCWARAGTSDLMAKEPKPAQARDCRKTDVRRRYQIEPQDLENPPTTRPCCAEVCVCLLRDLHKRSLKRMKLR